MMNNIKEKRNIKPEKALKILSKSGLNIDKNDVEKVLDLMYFLAKLIVNQNFKK